MTRDQAELLKAVKAVQSFLKLHADVLGPDFDSSRRTLDSLEHDLGKMAITQGSASIESKGKTAKIVALRKQFRAGHVQPILDIARLSKVDELRALRMPRRRAPVAELQSAAKAMADIIRPHATLFTDFALPTSFLDSLVGAANAIADEQATRDHHTSTRTSCTSGLGDMELRGSAILRVLDALVRARFNDPVLLAEWDKCRTIPRKPGPAATSTLPPKYPMGSIWQSAPPTAASNAATSGPTTTPPVSPEASSTGKVSPERVSPEGAPGGRVSAKHASPESASTGNVSPDHASTDRASTGSASQDAAPPASASPEVRKTRDDAMLPDTIV